MSDPPWDASLYAGGADIQDVLEGLDLIGASVIEAGWTSGLRDFEVCLADGRVLLFEDCLQASFHRPPSGPQPLEIGGWWTDEPSPVLLSLGPEIRFQYRHLVFELGDGLLRVACRRLSAGQEGSSPTADG
jgi:hypothetical protein